MCDLCKHDIKTKEETSKDDEEWYNVYSADQEVLFLYYLQVRLYKAAKAARLSGATKCTGQQWAKRLKEDPEWNIFEKQTNHDKRKTGMLQCCIQLWCYWKKAIKSMTCELDSLLRRAEYY